ncbi:efflux RND transporter periplasmic adaptor subunit [Lysobacter sp. A289]
MKFNRKWVAAALVIAVVVVPLVIKNSRDARGIEVEIAPAEQHEVRPTILASGLLAYRTEVDLTAEVVGKVIEILVEEGDTVEKGQLLARLDPETYNNAIQREEASLRQNRISIERQRAELSLRQKQFERSQQLVAAQIIDRNTFDEDRNRLDVARADLRGSEEALKRTVAVLDEAREQRAKTEIRSPQSGQVVSLPIKVGETAIPSTSSLAGAKLMQIADTTTVQAELKVDEGDIAKVALGQHADVYPAAYPEQAIKGTVSQIALVPTVEGQGRAYLVTVHLDRPDGLVLRSGMSVRADLFLSDGRKHLVVPVEAVLTDTSEADQTTRHVWVARDGQAHKATVTTGPSDDRWESIEKGLSAGDKVIVGPARTLRTLNEGDNVEAVKADKKKDADSDSSDRDDGDNASDDDAA